MGRKIVLGLFIAILISTIVFAVISKCHQRRLVLSFPFLSCKEQFNAKTSSMFWSANENIVIFGLPPYINMYMTFTKKRNNARNSRECQWFTNYFSFRSNHQRNIFLRANIWQAPYIGDMFINIGIRKIIGEFIRTNLGTNANSQIFCWSIPAILPSRENPPYIFTIITKVSCLFNFNIFQKDESSLGGSQGIFSNLSTFFCGISSFLGDCEGSFHISGLFLGNFPQSSGSPPQSQCKSRDCNGGGGTDKIAMGFNPSADRYDCIFKDEKERDQFIQGALLSFGLYLFYGLSGNID